MSKRIQCWGSQEVEICVSEKKTPNFRWQCKPSSFSSLDILLLLPQWHSSTMRHLVRFTGQSWRVQLSWSCNKILDNSSPSLMKKCTGRLMRAQLNLVWNNWQLSSDALYQKPVSFKIDCVSGFQWKYQVKTAGNWKYSWSFESILINSQVLHLWPWVFSYSPDWWSRR